MSGELSQPEPGLQVSAAVAARLATEQGVWLVTKRRSGPPHVTPVWFVFDQSRSTWWISTGARSVKTRNIADRPEVALALEDGMHPVVAEGVARIHQAPFPCSMIEAFARKYDGWDITVPDAPGDIRVLLEVTTQRWLLHED